MNPSANLVERDPGQRDLPSLGHRPLEAGNHQLSRNHYTSCIAREDAVEVNGRTADGVPKAGTEKRNLSAQVGVAIRSG